MPDIQPKNKLWSVEAIERFRSSVAGVKLQARVVEFREHGMGIELTDLSTSYPRIISDILIEENLVLQTSSPHKTLPSSQPTNKQEFHVDFSMRQGIILNIPCHLNGPSFAS